MSSTTTTPTRTIDELLAEITEVKASQALLEGRLSGLLDQLSSALDAGELDPSFSFNDWNFTHCAGRKTWDYPKEIKAQVKAIQEAAQASGVATQKTGNGYWTIKAPSI